jgi:hypothetical protein
MEQYSQLLNDKRRFQIVNTTRIIGLVFLLAGTPALAQNTDHWDWRITPYLWGINMTGDVSIGPINQDIDVSFSDILSDMEIGG